jgi:hypothetical protein
VDGFQAQGNLQAALQSISEAENGVSYERWVRFHHDEAERTALLSNGRVIGRWDGTRIKKAPGVIEFDNVGRW